MSEDMSEIIRLSEQVNDGLDCSRHEWSEPVALELVPLPEFPIEYFPEPLRGFVKDLSSFTETPVELAALTSLSVVGVCSAKAYEVNVKQGYSEPTNIWTMCVLGPANRKSAVQDACTLPLHLWEEKQATRLAPGIREQRGRLDADSQRIKHLQNELAKTEDSVERETLLKQILEFEKNLPVISRNPRLTTTDSTPEQLAGLMSQNFGRMGWMSDEGGLFATMSGRYSKGVANLDVFLKGHAKGRIQVDRRSGEPILVEKSALTMGISLQPNVLHGLSQNPELKGRGILGRILFAVPLSPIGKRTFDSLPMQFHFERGYSAMIEGILDETFESNPLRLKKTRYIQLSPEAQRAYHDFALKIEPRMAEDGDLDAFQDWAGKLPGAMIRIAGLFHIAKYHKIDPSTVPLGAETIQFAVLVAEALIPHAKAAFGLLGANPDIEIARAALRWIKKNGATSLKRSELHNGLGSRCRHAKDLTGALELLVDHGYLRGEDKRATGGRPASVYAVNPLFLSGGALS